MILTLLKDKNLGPTKIKPNAITITKVKVIEATGPESISFQGLSVFIKFLLLSELAAVFVIT